MSALNKLTDIPRRLLFDVPVHALTMDEAVEVCSAAVREDVPIVVGAVNAAKVVKMRSAPRLRNAVLGCDLVIADGASIVWASRILGRSLPERVTGIDLFARLLERAEREGSSVYFLGATQDVLDRMLSELRKGMPRLEVAGSHHGYFTDAEEAEVLAKVREAAADYLFVGMGTPFKELFLARNSSATGARVMHGVGGSFDVLSGMVKRAPPMWQSLGLEWLYRVYQEPRRMWKRYLITNTVFMTWLARDWIANLLPVRATEASHKPPSRPSK